jgi:hypothetical protein
MAWHQVKGVLKMKMRTASLIFLLAFVLGIGAVGAAGWEPTYNMGPASGATFAGPINAMGFGATYTPTDGGSGVYNGWGQVAIQTITAAETSDDNQIMLAGTAINATGWENYTTFVAQPDVPRNILATPSKSTSGNLYITGTDIAGTAITETINWAGSGSAKGSLKAFKTVTRLDFSIFDSGTTFTIGTGDVLGLNTKLPCNTVLFDTVNGVRDGTAPTVTFSSTVLSLNTIDTNTVPGGYNTVIYYVVS